MRLGRAFLSGGLSALLCVSQSPVIAAGGSLQPLGPWKIENRVTQCMASREYGDADKPITFAIIPAPNGSGFDLLFAYRRSAQAIAQEVQGYVDFGSGEAVSWLLRYVTGDRKQTVYRLRLSSEQMAQAGSAQGISLHVKREITANLALGQMAPTLDALQKCQLQIQSYWNVNGEKNGTIATPAKGNVRAIFRPKDYPLDALSRNQQGTSQYLLMIDEKGSIAGCHTLKPSGVAILDAMGCAVIQENSKFSPALDSHGHPVRSTAVTPPIHWAIPS